MSRRIPRENCEIVECFGIGCINGDCDPQTETCNCFPNYYGEGCDILCVNGEYVNGGCDCSIGYEGVACETESRCRFIGWWGCKQWTITSHNGGSTTSDLNLGSVKFEEGFNAFEVELFPIESSNGLMLLTTVDKVVGQVTGKRINFELQQLTNQRTVYGSAVLGDDLILRMELFLFNPITSLTEVAKGTFILARSLKE